MKVSSCIWIIALVCVTVHLQAQFTLTNLENQLINMEEYDVEGWIIHLPSVSATLVSSGYTYGDLYTAETKTLSLAKAADQNSDLNVLANVRGSYGGVDWRRGKWGITANHEWTLDGSVAVPMETVQLLVQGNVSNDTRNTIIQPSATYQKIHRLSLGGYYAGDDGLIGAKIHLLSGVESVYTESLKIEVNAQEDFFALDFRKNIVIKSSGVINYNGRDDVEYIGGDQIFTPAPLTTNRGIGLSIYGKANLGDDLRIYGIIDDIGTIKWSRQAVTYTDQSQSSFNGIDIRDSYLRDEEYSLQDTLYSLLDIQKDVAPFTSSIGLSLLAGIQYAVSDQLSLEASYHGRSINGKLYSVADIYGRYALTDAISLSLGNRFAGKKIFNIGIGVSLCIAEKLCLVINSTNPWALGRYYDLSYGDFNLGMSYRW